MAILQYLIALVASRSKEFKLLALVFAGVLAPLVLLGKLAHRVEGRGFLWDDAILLWLHTHSSSALNSFFLLLTQGGRALVVVPFCIGILIYLWLHNRHGDAIFFGIATFGAMFLVLAAKVFFGRDRPALWPSIAPEPTFSFPSGHAMGTMAVTSTLIILLWPTKWRWPSVIIGAVFVLLVALSRLYLGVHYPTDILGGWCAALIWVGAVASAFDMRREHYLKRGWTYLSPLFRRTSH